MKTAYLDCNAGISGNMFLGSLINLGFSPEYLFDQLAKLPVKIPEITINNVIKQGISATLFDVPHFHEHQHRNLSSIISIIEEAGLEGEVATNAITCFRNLAVAEAKIHGISVDEIHFHEVGAIDAIVDIVGACLGVKFLQIEKMLVSPIRVGFGSIQCAHGMIPLPAPAALELLTGFTIFGGEFGGEWTTPTGAAILKTFASPAAEIPKMDVTKIGYGAGSSERPIPNVLRIIFGETQAVWGYKDEQLILETNIDNLNPELYGYLGEKILNAGAKDFYLTPVYMKKGRPGVLVTVLTEPEQAALIESIIFKETSTLGIRKYPVERRCLERKFLEITFFGETIRIKLAYQGDQVLKYAPEYEDCKKVAEKLNRPLKEIYEEAMLMAEKIVKSC